MELKITFWLQAKMNLQDDQFNGTVNVKAQYLVRCSYKLKSEGLTVIYTTKNLTDSLRC